MASPVHRGLSRTLLGTFAAALLLSAQAGWSQTEGLIAVDVVMLLDPGTPDPVDSSGAVSWQARVGNTDQASLQPGDLSVSLSATSMPSGVSIIANGTDWACSINSCVYQVALPAGGITSDLNILGVAPDTQQVGSIDLQTIAELDPAFFDTNPQNNVANDNVTVLPAGGPDYVISSFSGQPDPVAVSGQIDFTLVVANAEIGGKRSVRGLSPPTVSFTLASLPSGASFAGTPSGTNWTCGSTDCTFASPLSPGETTTPLSIPVIAPATGPGSVTLSALVGGDSSPGNNSGDATVTVASPPPQPDFAFRSIVGNPDPVDPNGRGQFVLVVEDAQISTRGVRSADGITAPSVSFTLDSTPSGVILGVPAGTNWLCNSSGCDYTANVSPSNPTEPLTIPFSAPSSGPGSITLQAQILGDTNTANNQGQAQVAIAGAGGVDLSFARFDVAPASVLVDEQIEYRVAIQNVGGRGFVAGDPGFTYTLSSDAGTATLLGTPSGSNWNCTASGCSYSGSLNAGEVSSEVRFSVRAPAVGPNAVTLSGEIFGDIDPSNNQGSATAQVEAAPPPEPVQLTLDKQGPADVEAGASFDYQIVVSNTGAVTARQLQVVDFLPDGLALLGVSADLGWSCQNIGSRVDCQRSSLEVGQSTQISLQARLDDPGEYVNRVELTAQDLASNLSDQVVTVVRAPGASVDLRLRKSDVADPVVAGGTVVYLLDVINIGTLPATDVTLIDELPDDLTLLSATGPGWSCSGNVVCKLAGALADGASAQLRIEARAPTGNANILNQASVSSAEVDLNPQDNVDDEQTTITGSVGAAVADLALTGGPTALTTIGESFALTADVGNLGPDTAQGVQLSGQLDPAAELLSATLGTQSCSVTGSSFSCLLGGLESGANLGLSVQARAVQIQGGVLQLQLTAQTDDPRLANNAASVSFAVRTNGSADLSVSGSATPDPVPSGGIVQYTAALRNEGPDPVTDASYSIVLSEGQIILDVSGSGLSCVNAAALATCQLTGELVVGAQRQATLRAQVSAAAGSTIEAQIINLAPLDPNPTNDRATVRVQVGERSEEGIRDQLGGSAGSDPTAGAAVSPVAEQCADPSAALADFCDDLLQASDAEVRDALAATAPEESLSQAVLAREVSFAQFFNIDARLAELRGATGGFSSAGLMLSGSGGSLPLGQLLAGEDADDSGGLFGSPWGFFINGTISNGEQDARAQRNQVGVDFESRGITAGVDYRFSNALTAGVALGYADFDADISGDSSIDTQGLLLTGYASWYPTERFYLDGRLSLGQIDFEQARRVRFTLDGQTTDLLARGDANADQFSLAAGMGYHWNSGAWNITPNASLRYTDTQIDSFTETGAGAFNLRYDDADTDSLLVAAGVQVSRAFSTSRGVLTPTMSLSFNHENNDEDLSIVARFADGGNQSFRFDAPASDSTYGALGLGMVYVGPNGVQAYLNYRTVFGYDDFERDTINLGARFEF